MFGVIVSREVFFFFFFFVSAFIKGLRGDGLMARSTGHVVERKGSDEASDGAEQLCVCVCAFRCGV